jgi:hypothetical protein
MRHRAFPFTAPAKVTAESVVGIVVANGRPANPDLGTIDLSRRVIAGHLLLMGLEIVPVEQPRRPWWRPKRNGGST